MSRIIENVDTFILELLHIEDIDKNKLISLDAGNNAKVFYLSNSKKQNLSKYTIDIISKRFGKPGNTVLRKSSVGTGSEQILGSEINEFEWTDGNGNSDAVFLHKFIDGVYSDLAVKGNNPLFLSVGSVTWKISGKDNEVRTIHSPLLLFPIRLVRPGGKNSLVYIEFVNDDVYLNPCFLAKLEQVAGEKIVNEFPHPCGKSDEPIDIESLSDHESYFEKVKNYVDEQGREDISEDTVFSFNKDVVAILQYNHDELCMYYDIKSNKEKIYNHPLVNRIFTENDSIPNVNIDSVSPQFIAQRDSVQERIIKRILAGESLVIKGPPGTGKTLTITNLISSLLAQNKKVLLSSQKSAAMFEVYNKLPEGLRRFVMLLDSETEAQAAKLNVVEVKKEFNALLKDRKTLSFPSSVYDDFDSGNIQLNSALGYLSGYYKTVFAENGLFGGNYFNALDVLCRIDADPILFALPEDVARLTREQYNLLYKKVEDASSWFEKIAPSHSLIKNPWWPINGYAVSFDYDSAVEHNLKTVDLINSLLNLCSSAILPVCDNYKDLSLGLIDFLTSYEVNENQAQLVFDSEKADGVKEVISYYNELETVNSLSKKISLVSTDNIDKIADKLDKAKFELDFTKCQFEEMSDSFDVLLLLNDKTKMDLLFSANKSVSELDEKIKKTESEFYFIFRSDLTDEDKAYIGQSISVLSKYFNEETLNKPKLLDFKGKKIFEKLSTFGYGKSLDFKEVVLGTKLYSEMDGFKRAKEDIKAKISAHFRRVLTDKQIEMLLWISFRLDNSEARIIKFLSALQNNIELIKLAMQNVSGNVDYKLSELKALYGYKTIIEGLKKALNDLGISGESEEYYIDQAKVIAYIDAIKKSTVLGASAKDVCEKAKLIREKGDGISDIITQILTRFNEFGDRYFENYYTDAFQNITLNDAEIFLIHATDKKVINAVNEYTLLTADYEKKISVGRFFKQFESGVREKGKYSLCEHFEHSVYALAVVFMQLLMKEKKNGLCDKASKAFEDFIIASDKINKANISIIEKLCMERINPNDDDFAFLQSERAVGQTLRKMFKLHAKAVMKLKKCFILSPSTASMFFAKEEYCNFDIVIIDEASQLRPTSILPLLFRAKQVILVGDEWQMPPIKHFSTSIERTLTDSEGEARILSPNTSVLSLALENCAFHIEQLLCHYRSKTETLISFSQERFYPNMRTFPSPQPIADGLGFKDVYIPEGRCVDGVNVEEAKAVVKELNLLFDKYYDNEKQTLSQAIGVVAFGQKQRDYIVSLVDKDTELSKKIKTALSNFNDLPEKLIFFKTIETVQGQETDHFVLSITYGKNKDGKIVQSFGELNRGFENDKLGECIFNVAVTRAKSSVTVVHSVEASEIKRDSVEFIGQYLDTVMRFSKVGKAQWLGSSVDEVQGFIKQVADFVIGCGVDKERIVINCGANKGSVKIPIVILSKDLTTAEFAIWCEQPPKKEYDYVDYNVRYVESLKQRGWQITRLFIHDWVNNKKAEKENLEKLIKKYVK